MFFLIFNRVHEQKSFVISNIGRCGFHLVHTLYTVANDLDEMNKKYQEFFSNKTMIRVKNFDLHKHF